jgi:hypothetical protein
MVTRTTVALVGIGDDGFVRTVSDLTVTGDLVVLGETRSQTGSGSAFWETADANAHYWAYEVPVGTSTQVPVMGIGIGLQNVDLGLFHGITQPTLAILDADRNSFIALDFSADDAARLRSNQNITIDPTGNLLVGTDGSGHDVIFYSGTSGDNLTWDADNESLDITGTDGQVSLDVIDGDVRITDKLYFYDHGGGEYIYSNGSKLFVYAADTEFSGNIIVGGNTTTVNSTTVTIDDPIFTLGGDTAPDSDDNKDRGIEFRYYDSQARIGFFGYDDSETAFTGYTAATNSSEVFSGTVINAIFGNITGTLQTASQGNITTVGTLDGGAISSGFGNIDNGSSTITTTGLISGGSLDIDNVLIDGSTIGHTDDTDLITVADGLVTVAGEISVTTLDIGSTNVTATATELNIMDGDTGATTPTLGDTDRVVVNDGGTMTQVAMTTMNTYFESEIDTLSNLVTTGALDSGSITSGFGSINNGSSAITTTGTISGGSVVLDGNKSVTVGDGGALHVDTHTITDSGTSGSGTATKYVHVAIEAPTLAATNSSVTTSDAATLYINAAATAGTNQTITRNWAMWVDAGNARFDGSIFSGTTEAIDSSGLITVASQTGITSAGNLATVGALNAGSITSGFGNINNGSSTITTTGTVSGGGFTLSAGQLLIDGDQSVTPGDGAVVHIDAHTVTDSNTSGSGTATKYTHINVESPTLAATNSSVTTSDAATVYIQGAITAGSNQTLTRNYALWVDAGAVRLDGTLQVGVDGSGVDVVFYSGTAGDNLTWDASEEVLNITGTNGATALDVLDGDLRVVDNLYLYDRGGEKLASDGTDLTISSGAKINLTASSDIHIPKDIGLVFDDNASEKIESDDTDLTIASGAKINLNATSDVHVPNGAGLVVGHTAQNSVGYASELQVLGTTVADSSIKLGHWSTTAANQPMIVFFRSTQSSIAASDGNSENQSGDRLGEIRWYGDDTDTSDAADVAAIRVEATANYTDNNAPAKMLFRTNGGSQYASTRWSILPSNTLEGNGESYITTSSNDLHIKPATGDVIMGGIAGGRLFLSADSTANPADAIGVAWGENESNKAMELYYDGSDNVLILKSQNVDPIWTIQRVEGWFVAHTGVKIGANANNNWLDDATHGSGSTTMYIGNETITTSSDSRVKEDIADTSVDAVELLDKLRVVDFTWNDVNDTSDYGKNYRGRYVGMVAQETIKHAPWIINDQGGGKDCPQCSIGNECDEHLPWHVEYHHLVPTLVKAIQELNKEISDLKGGN